MQLQGKSAIVTGAASGIGAEIARVFAAAGAKVCLADVDGEAAKKTSATLENAIAVRMDVTQEAEVERGVEEVARRLGGIDILVSNAGVQHLDTIADVSLADWKRVLAIHLDGGFLTTRACLRRMIAQGRGGAVILMGSVHSKEASVQKGPYVVAKHGLLGLTRVVAKEGAPHGIRANAICPGFVRTALVERQIPQLSKELTASSPRSPHGEGRPGSSRRAQGACATPARARRARRRRVFSRAPAPPRTPGRRGIPRCRWRSDCAGCARARPPGAG